MRELGSHGWGVLSAIHRRIEDRLDKIDEKLANLKEHFTGVITIALTVGDSEADSDTEATGAGTQEDPIVLD